jgi:hypothetical protein
MVSNDLMKINNTNVFINEDYRHEEKFEKVNKESRKHVEYPVTTTNIINKLSQLGTVLSFATFIPRFGNYFNKERLDQVVKVCQLPGQVYELKEGCAEVPSDRKTKLDSISSAAKVASSACKILGTAALLSRPLLSPPIALAVTAVAGYAMNISSTIDRGLMAKNIYNQLYPTK